MAASTLSPLSIASKAATCRLSSLPAVRHVSFRSKETDQTRIYCKFGNRLPDRGAGNAAPLSVTLSCPSAFPTLCGRREVRALSVPESVRVSSTLVPPPRESIALEPRERDSVLQATEGRAVSEDTDAYFAEDARPIILFDGICNFCNAGINFVLDHDTKGELRMAALQSPAGAKLLVRSGKRPDDYSSIVLVERDRSTFKSDAVLRIASYLQSPLPGFSAAAFLLPLFLRDTVYDVIADNRLLIMGQRDSCRLDHAGKKDRFVIN